jgi:ABC-type sugar transport system ATPase subunit
MLKKRELRRNASAALEALGCGFGPDVRVGTLSVAMQQMVEIARAEAFSANVVIFDEPTASLTDNEKDQLFHTIRGLKDRGAGIVYISHKMDEIFDITDRITVLRDGQVQGTVETRNRPQPDHPHDDRANAGCLFRQGQGSVRCRSAACRGPEQDRSLPQRLVFGA